MSKSEKAPYLSDRIYFDPKRLLNESDFGVFESSNYTESKINQTLIDERKEKLEKRLKQ